MKRIIKLFSLAILCYFSIVLCINFVANNNTVIHHNISNKQQELKNGKILENSKTSSESSPDSYNTKCDLDAEEEKTETDDTANKWELKKDRVPLPESAYESQSDNVLACIKDLIH